VAITYTLIATVAPTSSASILDFDNIPATYTDLRLVMSARSANEANAWIGGNISINGAAANSGVTFQRFLSYSTGGSFTNITDTSAGGWGMYNGTSTTANTYSANVMYFPNYAWTNQKQAYFYGANTNGSSQASLIIRNAANMTTTSPISRLTLSAGSNVFTTGSVASLYGILKA
jgi:hypothetical protein